MSPRAEVSCEERISQSYSHYCEHGYSFATVHLDDGALSVERHDVHECASTKLSLIDVLGVEGLDITLIEAREDFNNIVVAAFKPDDLT